MQFLETTGLKQFKSQIYLLDNLNNNDVYIMRDDLLPFSFGGNKARKSYYFFEDILNNNYNFVITYGSASSNHCRIVANLAKKYNLGCGIISTDNESENYNKKLCQMYGAEFVYCTVDEVKDTINNQINIKEQQGFKPYFIMGGGHGNLGTKAYVDAFKEIINYQEEKKIKFDYIFHASGTGTTQAGLIAGKIINNSNVNIIGISIARTNPHGKDVIIESVKDFIKADVDKEEVNFIDDYIAGGYGEYNEAIKEEVKNSMINYGIPMDTTYVGKAFWGMKEYIKKSEIYNKKIIFIHTGGTPLFFDRLKELL